MKTHLHWLRSFSSIRSGLILVLISGVAGCDRQEIKVYETAKDAPAPPATQPATLPANHPPIDSAAPPAVADAAKPQWTVPPNWTTEPPTAMLLAKFSAKTGVEKADITISSFGGDVGGMLGNVNRWRGQVGLASIGEGELAPLVQKAEVDSNPASLVEMEGTDGRTGRPARLICIAVSHEGQMWFFKMLGDVKVVTSEKEAFLKFVQSVKLPHVH